MSFLGECLAVAATAHKNDVDKGGHAYFLHCLTVMENLRQMGTTDELHLALAACHDIGEDHPEQLSTLHAIAEQYGHKDQFVSGLQLLTRRDGETYQMFIQRIVNCGRLGIIRIKKADLMHNSSITRLKGIGPKDQTRIKKYHRSWLELQEAESKLNE